MLVIRTVARPLLASIFVYGGIDTLRKPGPRAQPADRVVNRLAERLPERVGTREVVLGDAAIKVVAGGLLAFGKFPRVTSAALAAGLVPTTLAGHRFWEESDPAKRKQQRLHFTKNASILGGLLLASVDTQGKPSIAWRARRAARDVRRSAVDIKQSAAGARKTAVGAAQSAIGGAQSAVGAAQSAVGTAREMLPV
jgi:putative oxidoreductase